MHLHRGELHLVGKAFSKRRCRWVHCYDTTTSKLSAKMFSFHFPTKSLVKIGENQDFPSFFCFDCWQIVFSVAVEGGQARARCESQDGEEAGKTIHLPSVLEMLENSGNAWKCWKCLDQLKMLGNAGNVWKKDAKKCLKCDERLEIQEMLKSRAKEEVYRQQYILLECLKHCKYCKIVCKVR